MPTPTNSTFNLEIAAQVNQSSLFTPSGDVIADIVKFVNVKDASNDLRDSIKASLDSEIKNSKSTISEALESLRGVLIEAGIDKRRVSEVFTDLGFKDATKKTVKADEAKAAKAEALKAKLQPIIDELVALALSRTESPAEAISALRRAHLTLQGRIASK